MRKDYGRRVSQVSTKLRGAQTWSGAKLLFSKMDFLLYTAFVVQRFIRYLWLSVFCVASVSASLAAQPLLRQVGVASIDITPDYPVRLTGYASRKSESAGVAQHLFAKALAFGSDREKPSILITVDNCGVPGTVRDKVAARLHKKTRLDPNRLAVCSTHTHSGPWVKGFAPNIFGVPIPPDQQARVDRYTRELTDALESVALQALADRRPAHMTHALSHAGFAANRRTKGGPTDQELPILFVTDPDGKLRAVFASYACHCTTLTGDFNQICGDWAGYAQEFIQRAHPGSVALIALGCAGDANPDPRPGLELARRHGQEIADAVDSVLVETAAEMPPEPAGRTPGPRPAGGTSVARCAARAIDGKLICRTKQIELPFDHLPTRSEWETRARQTNYVSSHARLNLARLERGEVLPTQLKYQVRTWSFGDSLVMVFLPGEAVVDYSLQLKREFDSARLWVNAYANDVPCYIPSERVLKEGGYEGGGAMIFYDWPARFAAGIQVHIIGAVHDLIPRKFLKLDTAKRVAHVSSRLTLHASRFTLYDLPTAR